MKIALVTLDPIDIGSGYVFGFELNWPAIIVDVLVRHEPKQTLIQRPRNLPALLTTKCVLVVQCDPHAPMIKQRLIVVPLRKPIDYPGELRFVKLVDRMEQADKQPEIVALYVGTVEA